MKLIEFYERRAFGHYQKHFINPEEVAALSDLGEGETVVVLRNGDRITVSKPIAEVRTLLLEDGEGRS